MPHQSVEFVTPAKWQTALKACTVLEQKDRVSMRFSIKLVFAHV